MAIQTKSVRNALVWYDDRYTNRWLGAIGSNVVAWEMPVGLPRDDQSPYNPTRWISTTAGTNTILSSTTSGHRLLITTGGTEYNWVNIQTVGSAFKIAAGKPCYFGVRLAVGDGDVGDYLLGLCEVDTALLAVSGAHAVAVTDDGLYFYQLSTESVFKFNNELAGTITSTSTGVTTGDSIYHDFEFYYDGVSTLTAYADGTAVVAIATGLADQALTPSINVRAGASGAETCAIQWMRAIQIV